jgi:amidase
MNVKAVMETFEGVIVLLRANGVTVIDNANYPEYKEVNTVAPQQLVGPAEYKRDMAAYFSGLEINPQNIRSIEDMISCTKSHSKVEYPSRDIAYWENVRTAEDFSSAKVVAAANRIKYLGGPGGIDGALDAANADALIFPSIVSSDVAGLASHPIVNVPLGFMPADTPVKKTPRGDLIEEGPNIPQALDDTVS